MDETDRPDDRRADGSWVLPNSESRRQRNHEAAKSKNSKRKKTRTYPRLSCKIEYLLPSNHSDRSIASEFFTGDSLAFGFLLCGVLRWLLRGLLCRFLRSFLWALLRGLVWALLGCGFFAFCTG